MKVKYQFEAIVELEVEEDRDMDDFLDQCDEDVTSDEILQNPVRTSIISMDGKVLAKRGWDPEELAHKAFPEAYRDSHGLESSIPEIPDDQDFDDLGQSKKPFLPEDMMRGE